MTGAEVHAALVEALATVADQLPEAPPGTRVDPAARLDIRGGSVDAALRCARAAVLDGDDGFTPSAATAGWGAAATVADRLVHGHRDPRKGQPPADPPSGFRTAWGEREQLDDWPWSWLRDDATPADRALAAADAARRVAALARMLDPWPPPEASHVGHRPSWSFPQRPLRLVGRVDVVLGRRNGGHALAVVLGGDHGATTRPRLAFEAVVEAAALRRPPREVLGLLPASGRRWALRVDDDLLGEGIAAAAATARVALAARQAGTVAAGVAAHPGPGCRWCRHRTGCDPGEAWLAGVGRLRHGFLPPPAVLPSAPRSE